MIDIDSNEVPIPKHLDSGAKWFLKEIDEKPFFLDEIPTAATMYTQDGRMLCGINRKFWESLSEYDRNEVLCHEAGHVAGGHDVRRQERDPKKWNIVCDAAIHYSKGVDPKTVEKIGGVTYDKLGIPPVPPEIGYDLLPDNPEGDGECNDPNAKAGKPGEGGKVCNNPSHHHGCGRDQHGAGKDTPSQKAQSRALVASIRGAAAMGQTGGQGSGSSRELPEVQPAYPDWMIELLTQLKKVVSYDESTRRWVKETRLDVDPIAMPGKAPKLGVKCTFIWDLSGSIGQEEVARFLGAVEATPELVGSEVVSFSDGVWGPRPVREVRELLAESQSGGTQFMKGASRRRPGVPCVWITDGYTGDGWPKAHDTDEFWVINTDVVPPHGIRIQS